MRPQGLSTKIFLDSGDTHETKEILSLLGFLDGQTTNPTLIAKNPEAKKRLEEGRKFTEDEIFAFYKSVVEEISRHIPQGSVSIEVPADATTSAEDMFSMGKEMFSWIPNAHIKYPTIVNGLAAAAESINAGMRVNMTLCFSQDQAAAVYVATKGAKKGDVFVSPFIGRLDDLGKNGMDLIKNITEMYKKGDGHVEVLSASVRTMEQFMATLFLKSDIVTAPFAVLKEWGEKGMPFPDAAFVYSSNLQPIPYEEVSLDQEWGTYDIAHQLTDKGIEKFVADWQQLLINV